jgi:hypothetical protein
MDEDQILQSIIADPKLTDPSIDVSQFRQTTPTRTELLADVPEFSGLKFDPTQRSYVEDLYSLYGGGAPLLPEPVVETPVVTTPIVDTSVMDQPAGDSVLDTTPTVITPTDSFGGNIVDEVALTGAAPGGVTGDPIDVGIPDIESGFVDPLGTISGSPMVGDFQEPTIGTVDPTKAFADQTPLSDVELAEQGFLKPISQVTPPEFEPTVTINETPETFIDKTKNFLGLDNINLPEFAIKAAINATVGKPITLAFDLAKNIFGGQTTQDQGVTSDAGFADVAQNIVDEVALTGGDDFDVTNEAAVNVGTPSYYGGGADRDPDPAPAPAPAPADIPDRGRGGNGGGGGRDSGGGSPGSAGPGGSDEMGSF